MADLKEKYRPKTFDDFAGNDDMVNLLIDLLDKDGGPPPAIMLTGPRGCGKTTLAGIYKNYLGIADADWKEMNTADDRGIEAMRRLREIMLYAPSKADGYRGIFMDECHKLTNDAQNALLKMLEKPPEHTRFILATTDPQLLLTTFKSRCKYLSVDFLNGDQIFALIDKIASKENIDISDKAIELIIEKSQGSAREAVDLLDTASVCKDEKSMLTAINRHFENEVKIIDLCQSLLKNDRWEKVSGILKGITEEPESVRYAVLGYMNSVLLNSPKGNGRAAVIISDFRESFIYSKKAGLTVACFASSKANNE